MNASNPKEPIKNIREPGGPIPPPNGPTTHPNRQARDPLSVFSLQFLIHQLDLLIVRWMAENRTRYHESLSCLLNNTVPEVRPTDSESPNGGRFRRHTTPLSGIPRQLWIATWNYNYKEGILRGCNFLVSNYWSVCSWMRSFFCSIFIHVMLLSFLDDRSFFDYRSWFYSSENYHEGLLRYAPKIALLEALFIALYLVLACLLDFTVLMIWKLRLWRIDFNLEELLENYYKGSDITREQNIKLIIQTLQLFGLENVDRKMVRKVLANPEYSDENIHDVAGIFANSYCLAPGKKKGDVWFMLIEVWRYFIVKDLPTRGYYQLVYKVSRGSLKKLQLWYPGKWIKSHIAPCLGALILVLLFFATQDDLKSWEDLVKEPSFFKRLTLVLVCLMPKVNVICGIIEGTTEVVNC